MKFNIAPVPFAQFAVPGLRMVRHQAPRSTAGMPAWDSNQHTTILEMDPMDDHLTVYRDEEIISWLTISRLNDNSVLVSIRYINKVDECKIEEQVLNYIENWSRDKAIDILYIDSCLMSVSFYEKLGYRSTGEEHVLGGNVNRRMVKILK